MSFDRSNVNMAAAAVQGADAYGHAALLLVESLIHGLIAREIIGVADAVEIVDIAIDVKTDDTLDRGLSSADLQQSLSLLQAIGGSLSRDLP